MSDFIASTGFDFEGSYFKLTTNLDFTDTAFPVIAGDGKAFQADFNGGGYTIDNVAVNATEKLTPTMACLALWALRVVYTTLLWAKIV